MASYGGVFEYAFFFNLENNITEEERVDGYLANHDVILEGQGMRIAYMGRYYVEKTNGLVQMNMTEADWRHLSGSRGDNVSSHLEEGTEIDLLVSREELLTILADIDRLLIRATFHIRQTEAR